MNLDFLKRKRILITGATGMIGRTLVNRIINFNLYIDKDERISVILPVRSIKKAIKCFGENNDYINLIEGDIRNIDLSGIQADYVVHAASQTSSRQFISNPIETISIAIDGIRNLLECIKKENIKKFIYLSTMEVYGTPYKGIKIDEDASSNLKTHNVRNCYSESKRMCENICAAYEAQFGIPYNILRLTQTFGTFNEYDDNRVFAEFARCAIEEKNIILRTKGETHRSYLYTEDAVDAILVVMEKAPNREMYNAANENTYCSIYEMAKLVADKICGNKISVEIIEEENDKNGFAPTLYMNLDTKKLKSLGWFPSVDLEMMFIKMIDYMRKGY